MCENKIKEREERKKKIMEKREIALSYLAIQCNRTSNKASPHTHTHKEWNGHASIYIHTLLIPTIDSLLVSINHAMIIWYKKIGYIPIPPMTLLLSVSLALKWWCCLHDWKLPLTRKKNPSVFLDQGCHDCGVDLFIWSFQRKITYPWCMCIVTRHNIAIQRVKERNVVVAQEWIRLFDLYKWQDDYARNDSSHTQEWLTC